MGIFRSFFFWLLLALVLCVFIASVWFWFMPIGVNNYINKISIKLALASPQTLTQIGMIDDTIIDFHSGKLDDHSEAFEDLMLQKMREFRAGLDRYGPEGLVGQELLSWKIAAWFLEDSIRQAEIKYGGYRVNQISGVTIDLPQFLTDIHVIKSERSAERYIARLKEFGRVLREVKTRVEDDRAHGVVPPDFVIDKTLIGMRAFIEGGAARNPLVTTLPERFEKAGIRPAIREDIIAKATSLVQSEIIPGYEAMIALFEQMRLTASSDAGIWRLPQGEAIYAAALKSSTSTDLSAEQIHELGLAEVERLEKEMLVILDAQGIRGRTLLERFQVLNTRSDQLFANDDIGRKQMIDHLMSINERVMSEAPRFFKTIPPQALEIVKVPSYAQDASPGGYYSAPALDGSRPGRFYINQKNTADNPKYTLATLIIHEGSPGHHFQLSAAQLMKGVPILRQVLPFTAFAEGWALYAERIAKSDMGIYNDDPLGDLGRLQAEMFRAVRLVVDSGMHAKRWTREHAIHYMLAKTGMPEAEVTREIERYAVWPGQATAYKVGQLAILGARSRAESALKDRFNIKDFHDLLLMNGAMPLGILDEAVDAWIATTRARPR